MKPGSIKQAIHQLQTDAVQARHRRVVVFAGEENWCRQQAALVVEQLQPLQGVWLGETKQSALTSLSFSQAHHWLGRETDLVVMDSHSGFDPDAIAAISGTLKAGGLFIWLMPSLQQLPAWADPELKRLQSHGADDVQHSLFLERLMRCLRDDSAVYCVEQGKPLDDLPEASTTEPTAASVPAPFISEDQQQAVAAVMKVVTGHRRRPLVLTADRGRGKSAAFGIAAAQLLQQGKQHIRVIAPSWSSVETLFQHAERLLPDTKREGQCLQYGDARLEFVAPDAVDYSPVDLLLVDEAAALPVSLLETLLQQHSRIAFATTVHGYEGTGRGFALRFRKHLDMQTPDWQELILQQPVRWSLGDPLEAFIFRTLLLDAEPGDVAALDADAVQSCQLLALSRDQLLADESLLSQCFGLLVQAHYRTRPFDLRLLLDAGNIHLYAAQYRQQLLAVCLVVEEGGLEQSLAGPVFKGERWLKGHLLPQLMQVQLSENILSLRGARIMRIAVQAELQGQGIGTRLVQFVEQDCRHKQLDWLGASFGVNPDLLDFWTRQILQPVSLASQPEARSGEYSLAMVKSLNDSVEPLMHGVSQRAGARFIDGLASIWATLDFELVEQLIVQWQDVVTPLSTADRLEVHAFSSGKRRHEDSAMALRRWLLHQLASREGIELDESVRQLLIGRLLQNHDWEKCAQRLSLSGKKPVLDVMRKQISVQLTD